MVSRMPSRVIARLGDVDRRFCKVRGGQLFHPVGVVDQLPKGEPS